MKPNAHDTSSSSMDKNWRLSKDDTFGNTLTTQISSREEFAKMITRNEYLSAEHHKMKQSYENAMEMSQQMKAAYHELRTHCYLLEEDKKNLFKHAKWQEDHILLLQKDITELNTCNNNSAILIENLKKENTILQISIAEKSMLADFSLQANIDTIQQKLEFQMRQREEAYIVISELRSKLKKMSRRYDKVKDNNTELKNCILLYERKFEDILARASTGNEAGTRYNRANTDKHSSAHGCHSMNMSLFGESECGSETLEEKLYASRAS